MSTSRDGIEASPRSKTSGGKEGSGFIDSFYSSLTGRTKPESFAGDQDDGVLAGVDSGDEGGPGLADGGVPRSGESGSDESDEIADENNDSDTDTDGQLNQASDQAQLVGGNKNECDPKAQGSLKKRSRKNRKKNLKGTKSTSSPEDNAGTVSPQQKSSRPKQFGQAVYQLVNPMGYINYFFGSEPARNQSNS